MSLSDIKKATAAFKPTLNRTFRVDESFVVPAKIKVVESTSMLTEMAVANVKGVDGKDIIATGGEQHLIRHANRVKTALSLEKLAAGATPTREQLEALHTPFESLHKHGEKGAGARVTATDTAHAGELAMLDHAKQLKELGKHGNSVGHESESYQQHAASIAREPQYADFFKSAHARMEALKAKHPKPADFGKKAAPVAKSPAVALPAAPAISFE